jgi:hypothetical protein
MVERGEQYPGNEISVTNIPYLGNYGTKNKKPIEQGSNNEKKNP